MWGQDKYCNFTKINGNEWVKLAPELNSIKFGIEASGILFGYIIGEFNNWEKNENYKLVWEADHNNGNLRLSKELLLTDGHFKPGPHKYSYVLIDLNGNEITLSSNPEHFEPFTFIWNKPEAVLDIKASANYLLVGYELELIAVIDSQSMPKQVIEVEWDYYPKHPLFKFEGNKLKLTANPDELAEVTIKARSRNGFLASERTFPIQNTVREGKIVHFIKLDNLYDGDTFSWDLWTFEEDKSAEAVALTNRTDFGVAAISPYKNVIARKKIWDMCWHNEWAEQTGSFKLDKEADNYYIVYGDYEIYTSLKDVVLRTSPRIEYALIDDENKITANLSHAPLVGTVFELFINSKKIDNLDIIVKDQQKQLIITNLPKTIVATDMLEIRTNNNTYLPAKVLMREFLNKYYYPGNDMGIKFIDEQISLRIWAPTANRVDIVIYNTWDAQAEDFTNYYTLNYDPVTGTHHGYIDKNDNLGKFYLYRLSFDDLNSHGQYYTRVTYAVDPYAHAIGLNGDKGALIDLNHPESMPEDWLNDSRPKLNSLEETILYEMHIRDFTIDPNSNVPDRFRGKYLGAATNETNYMDPETGKAVTTGIDSLAELGITHVHILPIFDFSSVDETKTDDENNRNWGYDPKNYNAPDGSYSIDPYNPITRIKEVRTMVQAFHQKNIRVVMDMVYNHMTDTVNLDKIVPGYYFRSDSIGKFTNGSGCGNEMASERPMVSKFIVDSILHWINDYHIDGVRFDLMELIDLDTIKKVVAKLHAIDPSLIIYGEPWKGGYSPLTNGTYRGTQKNNNFSIFNDFFRDAIRGTNSPSNGFVNGDPHNPVHLWNIVEGLKGSISSLTARPSETINYADAHDNYTLWDQIEKSQNRNLAPGQYRKNLPENIFESPLVRQNILALGIILTAQGIPFIHGGAEFLRTKNGDHNSYKSSDKINAFHWQDKLSFKPVFDFVKGLISLRRNHPAFRMPTSEMVSHHLNIILAHNNDKSGVLISHFKDNANNDSWKDIIVIYNATAIDNYEINNLVPVINNGVWYIVVNHEKAGIETIEEVAVGKLPPIRSHSMMVIHS